MHPTQNRLQHQRRLTHMTLTALADRGVWHTRNRGGAGSYGGHGCRRYATDHLHCVESRSSTRAGRRAQERPVFLGGNALGGFTCHASLPYRRATAVQLSAAQVLAGCPRAPQARCSGAW